MRNKLTFHHLGIATRSIEKAVKVYTALGYSAGDVREEPSQNVKICFLSKSGCPDMELIEPLNEKAPITRIVQQSGTTPYHTCYTVENINDALEEMEDMGFRPLFEPLETQAMEPGYFCYLFSPNTGLVELYQPK